MRLCWSLLVALLAASVLPAPAAAAMVPHAVLGRDCAECPELVALAPGTFLMGGDENDPAFHESEGPRHERRIAKPFALARTEVTRRQFARFAEQTGVAEGACWTQTEGGWRDEETASWRNPGFDQTAEHPVACVSWTEASAFAAWLSRRTGKPYRLPTEAEWEYAARAGAAGEDYWDGDDRFACAHANINDVSGKNRFVKVALACDDGYTHTAPAARFLANPVGLHDMLGNVWEWTADCWRPRHDPAPRKWSAVGHGPCAERVMRGGAWFERPGPVRLSARERARAEARLSYTGFRLARDLTPAETEELFK